MEHSSGLNGRHRPRRNDAEDLPSPGGSDDNELDRPEGGTGQSGHRSTSLTTKSNMSPPQYSMGVLQQQAFSAMKTASTTRNSSSALMYRIPQTTIVYSPCLNPRLRRQHRSVRPIIRSPCSSIRISSPRIDVPWPSSITAGYNRPTRH